MGLARGSVPEGEPQAGGEISVPLISTTGQQVGLAAAAHVAAL